ncbi:hypothetical protein SOP87_30780, partial [Bacillus cereus]|uniref:hypothetical protein n=1 Tax=Bacillus cereus TaxID=1396 RepID=UPI002B2517D7
MESHQSGCEFHGDAGIQSAIDHAANGDTVLIRAGRYSPVAYRDIPYKDFVVRGYIVIDGKNLSVVGESGTLLDGGSGLAATAIVVRHAQVALRNLEIAGFRYEIEEDDI